MTLIVLQEPEMILLCLLCSVPMYKFHLELLPLKKINERLKV